VKVALINPPWVVRRGRNVWRNIASIMPPLGLAWLAATLEREGHRVKILDAHAERLLVDQVGGWLREQGPFDLVGITATTALIHNALDLARLVKSELPRARVVLGGVHPTVLPEEVLKEKAVEVVVRGEGEITLAALAAEKPLDDIKGLSFRRQGRVVHTPDQELIRDLDSLPLPAYHLLPMNKYRPAAGAAQRTPATSVLATRGCPGKCTFCYRIFGPRLRVRSGDHVAREVRHLQERYGIKEVCFYDDTFTAVKREVQAFCRALDDLKLDLTWSCFSRIDAFDEETFRMMKHTGCHQVMYGVETYHPRILENIKKRTDPERVREVIEATQRIGLTVRAAFMLGNPGETAETLDQNVRFAIALEPDLALFNITTPYPGTEMFEWAQKNNYLKTTNWEEYDLSVPVMELPTVSSRQVMACYRSAHRRFYLRPGYIWKHFKKLKNREEFISSIRAVRSVIGG
jgi:radical SAM superfamily enzyme YgiQ (UPF0313 family)